MTRIFAQLKTSKAEMLMHKQEGQHVTLGWPIAAKKAVPMKCRSAALQLRLKQFPCPNIQPPPNSKPKSGDARTYPYPWS
jgi:hypothetical protein